MRKLLKVGIVVLAVIVLLIISVFAAISFDFYLPFGRA